MNRALNFSSPLKAGSFWLTICFFILSFSPNTKKDNSAWLSKPAKPVNDQVCQAIMLDFTKPVDFNNSLATAEKREINPGEGKGKRSCLTQNGWCDNESKVQNSLWYYFVATENQSVNIEALGGNLQLAVYQIDDCNNFDTFEEMAANDNSKVATSALIENLVVEAGQKYYIQVDGYHGAKVFGGRLIMQPGTLQLKTPNPCKGKFKHTAIGHTGLTPGISNFDLCKGIFDLSTSSTPADESQDGLQFSYTELCGDGEITVQLDNITGKGFAGISIRESLDPEAKMISLYRQSFNYNVYREARLKTGQEVNVKKRLNPINKWLKIVRKGSMIDCYTSSDGSEWHILSNLYFEANECLLAGLAVKSESLDKTTVAFFENLLVIEGIKIKTKPHSFNKKANAFATAPVIGEFYPKGVTRGLTSLKIQMPVASDAKVNIFDRSGKQIHQKALILSKGTNTVLFDVSEWPEGNYIAYISTKQTTTPKTFSVLQ